MWGREDPTGEEYMLAEVIQQELQKLYPEARVRVDVRLDCKNSWEPITCTDCQLWYDHKGEHVCLTKGFYSWPNKKELDK